MSPNLRKVAGGADGPMDPIELEAARWLLLHDQEMTSAQAREFDHWLHSDERNSRVYAKLKQTWILLAHVPADRVPMPPHQGRRKLLASVVLAAAAAVVIGVMVLRPVRQSAAHLSRTVVTPVGSIEKIDLPDGSVIHVNTASAVEVAFSAAERGVQLVRGEANFSVAKDKSRPFIVRVGHVDVTAVGTAFNVRRNRDAIELLVTEGNVRVDDSASGENLLARTAGKEPMSGRPPAEADTAASQALARDDVPTPPRTGNALDRRPTMEAPLLSAGQRATISISAERKAMVAAVDPVSPDQAARALSWQNRRLEFSAESLDNIAAEFNRYNRHQLEIADADLGRQRFGGKFPANDFESLVRLLEANFGVVVERHENRTVLRASAPARP